MDTPRSESHRPPEYLRWPPPGLDRLQGDLSRILAELLVGGWLLVLPLLWSLNRGEGMIWPGAYDWWWWMGSAAASAIGLLLLLSAVVHIFGALRRARRGLELGYDWRTIALVAADSRKDTGFLLQGGQAFSLLEASRRRTLIDTRLRIAALWLAGGLWLPAAFSIGVLAAGQGVLNRYGLAMLALAPTLGLLLAGYLLRAWENGVLQRIGREWNRGPWGRDFELGEVQLWRQRYAVARGAPVTGGDGESGEIPRRLGIVMWVALPLAILILIPAAALVASGGIGPVLQAISVPGYGESERRIARLEPLWEYRAPVDPAVSAQEAGEALRALEQVGADSPPEVGPSPVRRYEIPFPGQTARTGLSLQNILLSLDRRAGEGETGMDVLFSMDDRLEEEELAFLEAAASHPAIAEFAILGRAQEIDFASGFWPAPFPGEMTAVDLPIPRFGVVRTAAYSSVARAAIMSREGREEEAERVLRETIAAGLLLGRDAPIVIGSLIGAVVAGIGSDALISFYRSAGREEAAEVLSDALVSAENVSGRVVRGYSQATFDADAFPAMVTDPDVLRGLRWEAFRTVATIAPCASAARILFGSQASYDQWLEEARRQLVRFPSEVALFDLISRGLEGASLKRIRSESPWPIRLYATAMGGGRSGSCGYAIERVQRGF